MIEMSSAEGLSSMESFFERSMFSKGLKSKMMQSKSSMFFSSFSVQREDLDESEGVSCHVLERFVFVAAEEKKKGFWGGVLNFESNKDK